MNHHKRYNVCIVWCNVWYTSMESTDLQCCSCAVSLFTKFGSYFSHLFMRLRTKFMSSSKFHCELMKRALCTRAYQKLVVQNVSNLIFCWRFACPGTIFIRKQTAHTVRKSPSSTLIYLNLSVQKSNERSWSQHFECALRLCFAFISFYLYYYELDELVKCFHTYSQNGQKNKKTSLIN